jgi:hypothetical protein
MRTLPAISLLPFPARGVRDGGLLIPTIDRGTGAPMALHGPSILVLPWYLVFFGDIFRSNAHVTAFERIAQGSNQHIDHLRVVHPRSETHSLR